MAGLPAVSPPPMTAGPRSRIVAVLLEQPKRALPIGFVAQAVGLSSAEVAEYLRPLIDLGFIRLDGDTLSLTREGLAPHA